MKKGRSGTSCGGGNSPHAPKVVFTIEWSKPSILLKQRRLFHSSYKISNIGSITRQMHWVAASFLLKKLTNKITFFPLTGSDMAQAFNTALKGIIKASSERTESNTVRSFLKLIQSQKPYINCQPEWKFCMDSITYYVQLSMLYTRNLCPINHAICKKLCIYIPKSQV